MVWAIEKKLADDDARPILFYPRAANCYYPKVKGLVTQANSIYNGQRFEDLWLDN
jgi:peptide/nickel transport system substrate-binding protein